MQNFRTEIKINVSHNPINYNSNILCVGSCFTENIGNWLRQIKFNCSTNPFGILFNPTAIENCIDRIVNKKLFTEDEFILNNDVWCNLQLHSAFNSLVKQSSINTANQSIEANNTKTNTLTHCIITLGTAWVYRHKKTNTVVANCHKTPSTEFTKELLSTDEIVNSLNAIYFLLNKNSSPTIILTLSPVRHLKDGFEENQLSKAHLLTAIHQFKKEKRGVEYFPANEIMMDDLRDYRFYNSDMIHPNQVAIDYIKNLFAETHIYKEELATIKETEEIISASLHRPFNKGSERNQKFIKNQLQKISILKSKKPGLDFSAEQTLFEAQIID